MRYLLALLICLPAAALEVTTDLDGGTYNETLIVTEPGVTISNVTIEGAPDNYIQGNGVDIRADNVTVQNCTIRYVRYAGVGSGGVSPDPADGQIGVRVLDNNMAFIHNGVWALGHDWLVEGNEVRRIQSFGTDANAVVFHGTGHTFRLNFFGDLRGSELGSSHTDGFQTWTTTSNITIEQNITQGFWQFVIVDGSGHQNYTIRDNVVFPVLPGEEQPTNGFSEIGLNIQNVANLVCERNTFIRLGPTAYNDQIDGGSFTNSIVYQCGQSHAFRNSTGVVVDQNIIFESQVPTWFGMESEIDDDPMLTDPAHLPVGRDEAFGPDAGWRLKDTSPYAGTHGAQIPVLGEPEPEPTDDLWHTGVTIAGPDGRMYELVGKPKGE